MTTRTLATIAFATAFALCLIVASSAHALVIDGTGFVSDWNLAPHLATQTHNANVVSGNTASTYANDYAPINYPNVGHVPSPGGSTGERWDLEEMHVRLTATNMLQVLVVTSLNYSSVYKGQTIYLGDLFLTFDDQQFGIVTQSGNQGLRAGDVYRIDAASDVQLLQDIGSASYYGSHKLVANDYGADDQIRDIAGPWAVKGDIDAAQRVGAASIASAVHNYGGDEGGTLLIEYTVDPNLFPLPVYFQAHQAIGCGNDVIRVAVQGSDIPEPASLALIGTGLLMMIPRHRKA